MQDYAPSVFKLYIPSNSGIKKAIKKGLFLSNGNTACTGTYVSNGHVLELLEDQVKPASVYELSLPVIYEDEHIALINKPAGITVSGNKLKTIYNALPFNLKLSNAMDALARPTPVHRLDNQTSGILLIAKTKTAQIELGRQFEAKTIHKCYCTVVIGDVLSNRTITTPIALKSAETSFEIIRTVKSLKHGSLTCLQVIPKTGRTHQIRIHLASIGHPIVGDKLYGDSENNKSGKGLFLNACELRFLHPLTFVPQHFKIETPYKFKTFLNREKRRWNTFNKN